MTEDRGGFKVLPRWIPRITLVAIAVAAAFLRFEMLGRYAGLPSADHGNYLVSANALLGHDVTGYGLEYPPLFFVLLLPLLKLVDPIFAVRIAVVAVSFLLPFPFYLLLRRSTGILAALLGAGLLTFAEAYSEMTAWGGGPDFLAISLMLGSALFLLAYLEKEDIRNLVLAAGLASLVVGVHQLTALVYALTVIVWAAVDSVRSLKSTNLVRLSRFGGLVILLSLPYALLYLHLSSRLAPQITPLWPDGFDGAWRSLVFVFRDSALLWLVFGILAAIGIGILIRERRPEGTVWVSMALVCGLLAFTILRDNAARPLYFLVLPVTAGAPVAIERGWRRMRVDLPSPDRHAASALLAIFVVLSTATMTTQSVQRMSVAVDWYHAIDAPELEALAWLKENTRVDSVVATSGLPLLERPEGNRYGWWIEGYAERRSFYTGSPSIYTFREQRAQVELANRFFTGNMVEQNSIIQVVENAPADQRNPGIYLRGESSDRLLFYLNDGATYVNYTADSQPAQNQSFYAYPLDPTAVATSAAWITDTAAPVIEVRRTLADIEVRRTEQLDGGLVLINLTAEARNGIVREIEAPVWVGFGLQLANLRITGTTLDGSVADALGFQTAFRLVVTPAAGAFLSVSVTNADPQFQVPVIRCHITVPANTSRTSVTFEMAFAGMAASPGESTDTIDAFDIARSIGVTYVFQARSLDDQYQRFWKDYVNFRQRFENSEIAVFELVP